MTNGQQIIPLLGDVFKVQEPISPSCPLVIFQKEVSLLALLQRQGAWPHYSMSDHPVHAMEA